MHRQPVARERWPLRSNHDHFIFEGLTFPADKVDLVEFATDADLDKDTLNLVRALPHRTFENVDDIWRAIGEGTRVMLGHEGSPRDDMGKEAAIKQNGWLHP